LRANLGRHDDSYIETYNMMRNIGGTGEGNGPFLTFHDGFATLARNVSEGGWNGFLNGWDRVALDSHRYLCFDTPNNYGLSYQASLVRLRFLSFWLSSFRGGEEG
jgi:glucan 1,3-beta-glucosidase